MNLIKICKNGLLKLKSSLKRFPYSLSFSTLTATILIFIINVESNFQTETIEILQRLAMTTALGFPLFLCLKTLFEKKTIKMRYKTIIRLISTLVLVFYYFFLLKNINMVTVTKFIALNLTLYLLFLVIPYFYKKKNFELYIVKIFSRLAVTIIYSLVLYGGLSITLFTINKLLNIPISGDLYISIWFAVIGIFAPIFMLAEIPEQNTKINIREYPHVLKILILYIIMPLITIYTIILYIYFAKILIIQQWPQGLVAHLVLWYASLNVLTLFFISPLQTKNNWVKLFIHWLPKAIFPLLIMMFLAIGIRINTYGITENRYYVVVLGLWIMGIMFYYVLSKKKNNVILLLTLAILAVLSTFGPWSSYSVSIHSQNNRFEKIVHKYDIVKNNTIIRNKVRITENDQRQIKAILRYFENNHKFNDIKYLPEDFKGKDTKKYFGFSYQGRFDYDKFQHFSYNLNLHKNNQVITTKNYDYLIQLSNHNNLFHITENNLKVKLNNITKEIIITQDSMEIYQQSLIPILKEIHQKNKNISKENLDLQKFIYRDQNENINLKYIFKSFYGNYEKTNQNNINIDHVDFYLLIAQ